MISVFLIEIFINESMAVRKWRVCKMSQNKNCSSCKKDIVNLKESTIFKCPKCGKTEIIRCDHCRKIAVEYECSNCGFIGS